MVTCGDDKKVIIYEISEAGYVKKTEVDGLHSRCIYSCSWSQNSNFIATAGSDNKVYVSELLKGDEFLLEPRLQSPPSEGHKNDVNCVAFHPSLNLLASCSDDRTIKVWNF